MPFPLRLAVADVERVGVLVSEALSSDVERVGVLGSEALSSLAVRTDPWFRFVLCPIEYNCMAAVTVSSLVAVGADSSMGVVVGSDGEPWVASPRDVSWEFGGIPGRLVEMREEMDMGFGRVVVGLADCDCAVCADEFGGPVGDHDGGVERAG